MIKKAKFILKASSAAIATALIAQGLVPELVFAQTATASTAQAPLPAVISTSPADDGGEIVITGSRIRTGFQTPTPVTAVTAEDLKNASPSNLADGLNQLPEFNGSTKTGNPGTAAATGNNGQNLLNLRRLGPGETLILLDGRRMAATNSLGSVDINTLPQALVQRVDVVTGGASAAYGSDAVAGVVNFVLNKRFEGLTGEFQGGQSAYHDLGLLSGSLAFGNKFMNGRLRLIGSVEFSRQKGIRTDQDSHRQWFEVAAGQIPNPVTGGVPSTIVISDIRSSLGAYGGLISSGTLKGTRFLPGGATATFNYGTITGSSFQSGGDGARLNIGFAPAQERSTAFMHADFEASNDLTLFAEANLSYAKTNQGAFVNFNTGANAFTIFRDNAFLPASVLTRMVAANVQSVPVGRYDNDFPIVEIVSKTPVFRGAFGLKGEINSKWSYDASVSYGRSRQDIIESNLTINRNLYVAADAVVNPANGQIVCRSTLTGLDPGCTPLNIFGSGSPSLAAIRYVTGDSVKFLVTQQKVVAANINGEFDERFSLGAGPIAIASGVEYRQELANQVVDPLSPTITDFTGVRGGPTSLSGKQGVFNFFNPLPLEGKYNVKEVYLETGLPLLRSLPFAQALDASASVRRASYSLSGSVTTWKGGINYSVNNDVRLRFTRSRDIRGPNILELFNTATQVNNNSVYKGVTTPTLLINSGNPGLLPERALTTTYGFVLQPSWVPGLEASVDFYDITINDAIGARAQQRTVDECVAGNAVACSFVTVTAANTLIVRLPSLNLNVQRVSGYDFELGYRTNVNDGKLAVRLLANHAIKDYSQAPGSSPVSTLGQPASPRWRGTIQANYTKGDWSLFLQERYINKTLFDVTKVEGIDTSLNSAPAVWYTNLRAGYRFKMFNAEQEAYLSVSNLFNRDPPIVTGNPTSFSSPTNQAYDTFGRFITAGVRFTY